MRTVLLLLPSVLAAQTTTFYIRPSPGSRFALEVYKSNKPAPRLPSSVQGKIAGSVTVWEVDGGTGTGPLNAFGVSRDPMEVQVSGK